MIGITLATYLLAVSANKENKLATRPRFLLTGKTPITILREGKGEWVRGRWVEGEVTPIEIEVNIQPLRLSQIVHMPEADRTKEWYVLYSSEEIREKLEGEGGYGSDTFVWEGRDFEVYRSRRFSMGVLDHWEAYAVRVERT